MKQLALRLSLLVLIPTLFSCAGSRFGNYRLTEQDAAAAIRQMLLVGTQESNFRGAFSKEVVLSTIFPESVTKVLNTLNTLGLTSEVDRFTTTLSSAAEQAATKSVPIFVSGINNMQFVDAMRIVKNGGTAGTDYLRIAVGDTLRRALRPVMQNAVEEYKLNEQWKKVVEPVQGVIGSKRLNLDLPTLMAGMVSEAMFRKIAEKETQVRADAAARTTPLLQKVFSRNWN
jgi:hypothetical protein